MSQHESQRHQFRSFVCGIAEHNTLVTSANVLKLAVHVHTSSNIRRLLLDGDQDIASLVVKALVGVVVTNAFNGVTNDFLVVNDVVGSNFSQNHNHTGLGGRFASNLGKLVVLEAVIKDSVRHLVSDFIFYGKNKNQRQFLEKRNKRKEEKRREKKRGEILPG
eukprot:Lithocolla_globosa_v1_NODE_1799_length_2327_cov_31.830620.p2 type:complete len:163 gc:universal NODE_1799_length_2327_cov_31.830620:1576-2064(+)